jgi:DNA relaxase NicK
LIGAVHEHHLLPEDGFFTSQWTRLEIDIEDFKIAIDAITHTGEGVGIHSSTWRQDWNARWRTFFQRSPGASRSQVFEFARELAKEFAID